MKAATVLLFAATLTLAFKATTQSQIRCYVGQAAEPKTTPFNESNASIFDACYKYSLIHAQRGAIVFVLYLPNQFTGGSTKSCYYLADSRMELMQNGLDGNGTSLTRRVVTPSARYD